MSFQFYNSLTRKIEKFTPINKEKVTIYSCGPTVYDLAHIGNFRSFLFNDLLGRALRLAGYQTSHAVNLTDVDDKTIRSVKEQNSEANLDDLRKFTDKYIKEFFLDLDQLGIEEFDFYPRATDYITEMIELVEKLVIKDYAYIEDQSVYYSIKKDKTYGKLANVNLSEIKTGTRYNTDEYKKDDIRDFVLWKAEKGNDKISWPSPFGLGRPGWHLECSAMIEKTFKGEIDIHTGGVDLIFPHHTNEIAQSCHAYDHKFVKTWLHCEHLLVDGKKMSKSSGNFYTLRDILKKGYHAIAIRYLILSVSYRQKLNFTFDGLDQATASLKKISHTIHRLKLVARNTKAVQNLEEKSLNYQKDFLRALQSDLNMSKAMAVFHEFIAFLNKTLDRSGDSLTENDQQDLLKLVDYFDQVLNLVKYSDDLKAEQSVPDEILQKLKDREQARKNKDFQKADQLRDYILAAGYEILDSAEGSTARKK